MIATGFDPDTFFAFGDSMTFSLLGTLSGTLLGFLMGFLSLLLILLILIQRGKGGGLTGALGGPGGQSAFGSKAGDTFTAITVVMALVWGFTCAFTMWLLGTHAPPAPMAESSMTSGPGDEDASVNEMAIPPLGGDPSGLPGIGSLDSLEPGATESETPSMELTPADPPATGEAETATTTEPESTPDSETPGSEAPGSETSASETSASETPETGSSDGDAAETSPETSGAEAESSETETDPSK